MMDENQIRQETSENDGFENKNSGLWTQNLTVGYDGIPLIRDVELHVHPGEILTLIGPNGSGKSTILKTITKQLSKIAGTIYVEGTPADKLKDSEISKQLSMVMTEQLRTELMTGREVVASGRYPYTGRLGILSEEDWKKVDEAIRLVNAKEVAEQDFRRISDGQRQRLMLARAICQDTQILVLDEPTSYLDMGFKLDILANIRRLAREKNIAIIMSLHELDLVSKISDTVACVKGDRIDRIGTPEEIFTGDYIQKLYGVEEMSFDPVTGQVFLHADKKAPEVFVIGGGGSGIAVYQKLQRKQIPFAAGILQENDVEFAAARALGSEVVSEKAFMPIGMDKVEKAKRLIDGCHSCICAVDEFGSQNEACLNLKEYAQEKGKLMYSV